MRIRSVSARTMVGLAIALAIGMAGAVTVAAPASADALTISGRITGDDGLGGGVVPLSPAQVSVYAPGVSLQDSPAPVPIATVMTDADGEYVFPALEPRRYILHVSAWTSLIADAWYGNTQFSGSTPVLDLAAEPLTGIDVQLSPTSTISGTVEWTQTVPSRPNVMAYLHDPATGEFQLQAQLTQVDASGYLFDSLPPGSYLIRISDGGGWYSGTTTFWDQSFWINDATPVVIPDDGARHQITGIDGLIEPPAVWRFRIAGSNRFATAASIAADGFGTEIDRVFVVNGLNYPDALSISPVAASLGAPILLVTPTTIPAETAAYLSTTTALTEIVVVGGEPSVSSDVLAALGAYAPSVRRIAGDSRFATARAVADEYFDTARTAWIATGLNYPDALAAGPAAARQGAPLLLVNGMAGSLDADSLDLLHRLGVQRIVIVGATASVSAGIEDQLRADPAFGNIVRLGGMNRFQTSAMIAEHAFPVLDSVFITTGYNFPDALAGAALAGSRGWMAPVLLSGPECISNWTGLTILQRHPSWFVLLGDTNSLGPKVGDLIICADLPYMPTLDAPVDSTTPLIPAPRELPSLDRTEG